MGLAMQAAARHKLRLVVLDRPNPIGGVAVEGGVVQPGFESFVGLWPICARHGLTAGEYARFINEKIGCDLRVAPLQGWRRDCWLRKKERKKERKTEKMPTPDTATRK